MKHKMSKATDISQKVKQTVFARDNSRCILCGNSECMPNGHVIPRSAGGLGIEENIVTLCQECHHDYDNGDKREIYGIIIRDYLKSIYPDWDESKLVYDKFAWLKGVS